MANTTVGALSVKITANTKGVKKGLTETSKNLKNSTKELKNNSKEWNTWSTKSTVAAAAVTAAIAMTTHKVIEYADAFTSMDNKLKIVTDSTENLVEITQKMFDISNDTRTSVESTTDLYTKMHRATRDLDISQGRLLKVTESINKAFAIGGATTQETTGAIRQLGQALASGTLRGDEFNSIAEQAPIIMEAVKEATGETAGSLRELAAEGAISAEILVESLERYADKIDTDFAKSTATFSQNVEIARNEAIKFVGANEDITAVVDVAGESVLLLAENLDVLVTVGKVAAVLYGATLVGSVVKTTAAMTAATATTNLWTGATSRMSVAAIAASRSMAILRGSMMALGGPVGILISTATALALFVDWESKSEKQTKETTKEINNQVAALKGLSTAQLDIKMNNWIQQQNELTEAIKKQRQRVDEVNNARDAGSVGHAVVKAQAQERLDALVAERLELQKLGNAIFDFKNEQLLAGGTDFIAEDEEIDLRQKKREAEQVKFNERMAAIRDKNAEDNLMREVEETLNHQEELRNRFATDAEMEDQRYADELVKLQAFEDAKGELTAEGREIEAALAQEHADRMTAIKEAEERAKMAIITHAIDSAANALLLGGKKTQKIGKKLAIISATIKGKQAAVDAWQAGMSTGGPWAPLVAAAYAANSVMQTASMINSIKSVGSGGGGGSRPSAGRVGAGSVSGATGSGATAPAVPAQRSVTIDIAGHALLSADMFRSIIEGINEQIGDGVKLNVEGG